MKQIVVSIAALLLLSTAAMAQDNQGQRPDRQRMDRTEMIKQRTDETVKKYGLNEEQAKQLISLNTKYLGQMGQRGPRRGGPGMGPGNGGQRPQMNDSTARRRPQGGQGGQRQGRPQMGGQMGGQMNEYNQELQKIMTPEQYKAYQADREERMRQFGGQRGPRRNQQ